MYKLAMKFLVVAAFAACISPVSGIALTSSQKSQPPQQTLIPNPIETSFGCSVSVANDYAIIGSAGHKAYIFEYKDGEWKQSQVFSFPWVSGFGASVCMSPSGDYAVVGAGSNEGTYVFKNNSGNWTIHQKLSVDVNYSNSTLSVFGDYMIIGGRNGKAYIFKNTDGLWTQQGSPLAFGNEITSVGIYADYAIVGGMGQAYVFRNNSGVWTHTQSLNPSHGGDKNFGVAVSIFGDYVIVGAPRDFSPGEAYVFKNNNGVWEQQGGVLEHSDKADQDDFGCSISMSDNYALIGAEGMGTEGGTGGKAYVFRNNNGKWEQLGSPMVVAPEKGTLFGNSVSMNSYGYALIGAPRAYNDIGRAYIYLAIND